MDIYLYLLIALIYLLILLWLLKSSSLHLHLLFRWTSVSILVALALIYDNTILALGTTIGESDLLYNLHLLSNWLHVILTPTLVIFCFASLQEVKIPWAQKGYFIVVGIAISIGLSIWEGFRVLKGIKLQSKEEFGVIFYTNIDTSSHIFGMIMVVMFVLLLTSIFLWYYCKFNLFFWGLIIMGIIMAIEGWVPSNAFTNLSELLLLAVILVTKRKLDLGQIYRSKY